jgi:folate-binding protein YgfZ
MVSTGSGDDSRSLLLGYTAARNRAAMIDRSDRAMIVVSGSDRASYLHGLLTNDITSLTSGTGCYAAYLTPQGRMISDLWVYELGDLILLAMPRTAKGTILAKLDQFIFSEDVKLGDVSETFVGTAVVGPAAADALASVLPGTPSEALQALAEHGNLRASFDGQPAIVVRVTDTGEPGFDVVVERESAASFQAALGRNGVIAVDAATADTLRIEAGIPKFHRDMDEDTIPLEAGIESRAISMTKGCYVGQEVIVRVLHRGHGRVARRLVGLVLEGRQLPADGAAVSSDDRDAGRITSAAFSPPHDAAIALAYVHRDFVEPGTALRVDNRPAVVTALPFVGGPGSTPPRAT